MALRTCRVCGYQALTEADLVKFQWHRQSKYGRANLCHTCKATQYTREEHNEYLRKWRVHNPEKVKTHQDRYRSKKRRPHLKLHLSTP